MTLFSLFSFFRVQPHYILIKNMKPENDVTGRQNNA